MGVKGLTFLPPHNFTCHKEMCYRQKCQKREEEILSLIGQSDLCNFLFTLGGISFHLTNGFHVAVRLFSNRSQMMSKCGKNKKVAHESIAECVTDVLTTF